MLVLLAGAMIPFFWVPILIWLAWRFTKRRSRAAGPGSGPINRLAARTRTQKRDQAGAVEAS